MTADLPTGSYFVRTSNAQGYVDELYDDFACVAGCDVVTGTPVTHAAGTTGSFADFDLIQGYRITGLVTETLAGPLGGVRVDIHYEGGTWIDVTTSHSPAEMIICGAVSSFSPFAIGVQTDVTPPIVACSVSPAELWPPNNTLRPVAANVSVTDPGGSGPAGFTLISVTSNEGTPADIVDFVVGTPDTNGSLRAARRGSGSGRRYTLTYEGRDLAGNAATCAVDVTVPHDQRGR